MNMQGTETAAVGSISHAIRALLAGSLVGTSRHCRDNVICLQLGGSRYSIVKTDNFLRSPGALSQRTKEGNGR